jgi:phosphoserine phosphatase RsbU/P
VTAAEHTPARILVVSPAGGDRDSLARAVQREGHAVDTARDAGEAFAKLRADPFDLILADVQLTGMPGPAFVQAVRSDAELAQIPVIALSGNDDLDALAECLEAGADDYLPRVYRLAVLKARIDAALGRRLLKGAEAMSREMAVARNIQKDFLPEALPLAMGVQLQAVLQPAREVSGDFYDAFTLAPSGAIVMVVGDVCDKGVGAALFMALFRSLIRASADPVAGGAIQMIGGRRTLVREALEAATPADLLTRVAGFTNDYIARLHGRTNMFATVFLAALNPMSGEFDYVNAGHEPAIVVAPDGGTTELRPTGPALGLLPDQAFRAGKGQLERGHTLFAFTDGVVEARSPAGEAFGGERLREALRANNRTVATLVSGVVDAVGAFTRQAEPHDDLTLLAAMRTM